LGIIGLLLDSENHSLQDIHQCDWRREVWVKSLTLEEYTLNLVDRFSNLPAELFKKCKEWADSAGGSIYLTCKQIEFPDSNEDPKFDMDGNYPKLSFLNKLLAKLKIEPNDNELMEFLKLAKSQTKTIITSESKIGQQKFQVAVSIS
jgi:hypothetical protein